MRTAPSPIPSPRSPFSWRRRTAAVGAVTLAFAGLVAAPAGLASASPATRHAGPAAATTDTSPIDLSTKIDKAAALAARKATVVSGHARFEVLTSGVVRMEYSPTGKFLNDPTSNVLYRKFAVPKFTKSTRHGWLTLRTSAMTVRYKVGSGPFSTLNTRLALLRRSANGTTEAAPTWTGECTFGQVCQSGAAIQTGGATIARADHTGYRSLAGFVSGYGTAGSSATWRVLGAPAGNAELAVRFSNGNTGSRTMSLVINGVAHQLTLRTTTDWNHWATVVASGDLQAGTNTVALTCGSADTCNVNIDTVAVTAHGAGAKPLTPAGRLGGYIRSYDSANGTYTLGTSCAPGQSDATCTAAIPAMAPGVLNRSGWFLLDDTQSDVWAANGWIKPRPAGDVQDGYLFGYSTNYTAALSDLVKLTGHSPMLPRNLFGTWFSRYFPYSAADYKNTLLPSFKANGVSLDALSVDTDWKVPNHWDGWEFNPKLFPNLAAFRSWAKAHDIMTTFNVHASINDQDPKYPTAQAISGHTLVPGSCFAPSACAVFDWSKIPQAEAYFALHQPIRRAGGAFTWLDWCCDDSKVTDPGVTPDSWINHLYAQQLVNSGQRGFVLSRIGASYQRDQAGAYPTGPWADHRSTLAFTGDTWGTWNTLASQAQLSQDEGSVGQAYVSDDIGSFIGTPSKTRNLPDDLYLRWLQLGAFQPVMRLHSDISQNSRLPWDYDKPTAAVGTSFLRLREQLVPYLYTLSHDASVTGLPMTKALYLDYPTQAGAYTHHGEYLLGSNMLVAPVTTPGQVATANIWFPPGHWTDYFTGATFTGPSTHVLRVPTSRMPVFVKAGGIVPLQPATGHAQTAGSAPLTVKVYAGANGRYSLYNDAGTGLGYRKGASTSTLITTRQQGRARTTVVVGATRGSFRGAPTTRAYTIAITDVSHPRAVLLNGRRLASSAWRYNRTSSSIIVAVPRSSVRRAVAVTQIGGTLVSGAEPAAVDLTLTAADTTFPAGVPTKVTATARNLGPGAVSGAKVTLRTPAGWTVTPTGSTSLGSLTSPATTTWTVTAPKHYTIGTTESVVATVTYTDTRSGRQQQVSAAVNRTPGAVAVTFRTRAPAGTPANATLYVPGSIPQLGPWDPGKVAMTNKGGGIWEATVTITDGTDLYYKYTRGDWNTVEDWGSIVGTVSREIVVNGGSTGTMLVDNTSTDWANTAIPDSRKAPQYWRDPVVVSTTPSDGASGAAPQAVTVKFQRDITPVPNSDYSGSVVVTSGGSAVAGTTTESSPGVLTWTPTTPLAAGTYHVTVDHVARANAADPMTIQKPYQFSFTVS